MTNAIVFGPFVLPYSLLLAFAAVASTRYVGNRSGRKAGIDVESVLWHTLLVGLILARRSPAKHQGQAGLCRTCPPQNGSACRCLAAASKSH